ncbi:MULTISPECIES: hypothetical protein [Sporosarcina]|uniref:hypothetical protein n=1 Tax=Sporosarcina TaxID=1569 RepID=UPI0011175815|nr:MULTISPECIES: hypothetical protein [Sporosarcina]MBY0224151.1 hypothetical protein [Sporosarcina aquimarina]
MLCSNDIPSSFHLLNAGALQAVGGAMRQTGVLPDWLIAGAIRKRRSEFSEVTLFIVSSLD